jgi:voltage-gated potassium channel
MSAVSTIIDIMGRGMTATFKRLAVVVVVALIILTAGAFGFAAVEHLSLVDAAYFTIVTVATVGYGDIHPLTVGGKLLAILLILVGVGTFSGVVVNSVGLLVERRERQSRQNRVSALVGLFYSEIGNSLIRELVSADPGRERLSKEVTIRAEWTERDFADLRLRVQQHQYVVSYNTATFANLRETLRVNTDLLLRLYENPSLTDEESFTELLRATLHLREELALRQSLSDLPGTDTAHLAFDAQRVYGPLAKQWLEYIYLLRKVRPYLFSLAVRTNPFDEARSPVVR